MCTKEVKCSNRPQLFLTFCCRVDTIPSARRWRGHSSGAHLPRQPLWVQRQLARATHSAGARGTFISSKVRALREVQKEILHIRNKSMAKNIFLAQIVRHFYLTLTAKKKKKKNCQDIRFFPTITESLIFKKNCLILTKVNRLFHGKLQHFPPDCRINGTKKFSSSICDKVWTLLNSIFVSFWQLTWMGCLAHCMP